MTPESLMTQGLIAGRGGGGGIAPDSSCIELVEAGTDYVTIRVIPPVDLSGYVGTKIEYGGIESCVYSEAGPESPQGTITISPLTEGTIYVFVPVAYGLGGSRAKPGNIILATVPVNIIDMPQLSLNSCSLEVIWQLIRSMIDSGDMTQTLRQADQQLETLTWQRSQLEERMRRLEANIAMLKRKL